MTGWNSPAILKLLKLAIVTTVSMKTAGSPTLRRDEGLTVGVRVIRGEPGVSLR